MNGEREAPTRALLLAACTALLLVSLTPWTTLWDRDEPRFATAAREMARSGDLLLPTFNGELRAQKPPLSTWLGGLSYRTLGAGELAARLWSPLGIAAAALATWAIGRRLLAARAGLWALAVLASSPLAVLEGVAATADALLLAFVAVAMATSVKGLANGFDARVTLALGLALGAAQLTKGPVGLAVPLLALVGTLILERRAGRPGTALRPLLMATLLGFLLFGAWALPANLATGGRLLEAGLGHEVLRRMATPLEGHGPGFFYYVPVLLLGMAPWTLHLPAALDALVRGVGTRPPARSLLLSWIALPLVLFTLLATKLPHYALPVFPPLALAVGATLERAGRLALDRREERLLRLGLWLFLPISALLAGVLVFALTSRLPVPDLSRPVAALLLAQGVTLAGVVPLHLKGRYVAAAGWLLSGTLAMEFLTGMALLPALEPLKPVPRLAAAIRAHTPASTPVYTFDFGEPSLVYYVDRTPVRILPNDGAVVAFAHEKSPGVLVCPRANLARVTRFSGRLPLREIASASGINLSKGEWLELVALERTP